MSNVIQTSRIPWLAECKGKRVEYITGCTNGPDVCAVRARGLCWAESGIKRPCRQDVGSCEDCWSNGTDVCTSKFNPTVHPDALDAVRRLRRPTTLAWNLGGDAFCDGVDDLWRIEMFRTILSRTQHTHIMLTKNPSLINHYWTNDESLWMGVSVTGVADLHLIRTLTDFTCAECHKWVSFEPLLHSPSMVTRAGGHLWYNGWAGFLKACGIEFIVIGGLSDGNGRIIPPEEGGTRPEWVQPIIEAAHEAGCRIFCKNLAGIWRTLVNPRTGELMRSATELREIPQEWLHA